MIEHIGSMMNVHKSDKDFMYNKSTLYCVIKNVDIDNLFMNITLQSFDKIHKQKHLINISPENIIVPNDNDLIIKALVKKFNIDNKQNVYIFGLLIDTILIYDKICYSFDNKHFYEFVWNECIDFHGHDYKSVNFDNDKIIFNYNDIDQIISI